MLDLPNLSRLIDARSFPSLWYWLVLAAAWSWANRGALGIPADVIRAARRDRRAGILLLDWVSLVAPRWRVGQAEGLVLVALASFVLAALGISGFLYGGQFAQALVLLVAPLMLLGWLRLRLAADLRRLLVRAQTAVDPGPVAVEAARRIAGHLLVTRALAVAAVTVAALVGARWMLVHPNGM